MRVPRVRGGSTGAGATRREMGFLWDGWAPTVVIPQDARASSSWFLSGILGIPIMVNHRDIGVLHCSFSLRYPGSSWPSSGCLWSPSWSFSEVSWGFLLWFISRTPSVPITVVWDFCILYCHPSPEWLDFSSCPYPGCPGFPSWSARMPGVFSCHPSPRC